MLQALGLLNEARDSVLESGVVPIGMIRELSRSLRALLKWDDDSDDMSPTTTSSWERTTEDSADSLDSPILFPNLTDFHITEPVRSDSDEYEGGPLRIRDPSLIYGQRAPMIKLEPGLDTWAQIRQDERLFEDPRHVIEFAASYIFDDW